MKNGITKVSSTDKMVKFTPAVTVRHDKMDINYFLGDNTSDIVMTIYDDEGNNIYTGQQKAQVTFHKRYDLSQLPKGKYSVHLQTGDDVFYYKIKLKESQTVHQDIVANKNK